MSIAPTLYQSLDTLMLRAKVIAQCEQIEKVGAVHTS